MADVEKEQRKTVTSGLAQVPVAREVAVGIEVSKTKFLTLEQATNEYLNNPTSESVTHFFQTFWAEKGKLVGKELTVPKFPGAIKGLEKMRKDKEPPIFDNPEVTYADLGKMFPNMDMGSWTNGIADTNNDSGWLSIDGSINAPHLGTFQEQLTKIFKQEEKQDISLRQYIIGSQISKLLTGKYFDQGSTWSRLASVYDNRYLYARFDSDGFCNIQWSEPIHWGGRGEKKVIEAV